MNLQKSISIKLLLGLCTGIVALGFSGCSVLPKEEQTLAPPLVEAAKVTYDEIPVKKGNIENTIKGTGSLVSVNQGTLFFKYKGGALKSINVKLGDKVKQGDVVAELDTDDLDSRIKQQELTNKGAQLTLDDANAQLAEDQKNLAAAQAAQDAVDAAKSQGKNPSQDDAVKAARLQDLTNQVRKSSSAVQRAQLDVEKNNLSMSDLQLQKSKATLVSDTNGIVTYVDNLHAGDNVVAFKSLVTVADPTKLSVQYTGDKMDSFEVGQKVNIKIKDTSLQGTVVTTPASMPVDTSKDAKKYVQINVDNLPEGATIGDYVDISLTLEKKDNVIVVSKDLIHNSDGRNYVFMLDKGLKVERNVELGIQNATDAEITSGLNEGEKVIK